jgi:hypothetical protein
VSHRDLEEALAAVILPRFFKSVKSVQSVVYLFPVFFDLLLSTSPPVLKVEIGIPFQPAFVLA